MSTTAPRNRMREAARPARWIAAFALALTLAGGGGAPAARVCEGPGINHRPPAAESDDVLSVLAFNVFLLPAASPW